MAFFFATEETLEAILTQLEAILDLPRSERGPKSVYMTERTLLSVKEALDGRVNQLRGIPEA